MKRAGLRGRLSTLEDRQGAGLALLSLDPSGGGRASTQIDGRRYTQGDDESREQFLERAAELAGKRSAIWVDELDAKL